MKSRVVGVTARTLVTAYAPWKLHAYRIENIVVHPWVLGYKYNTFDSHPWMYFDIDLERRKSRQVDGG